MRTPWCSRVTPLVGRGSELRAIEALLTSAAGDSAALLIEGDPGIGKTTLWLEALARARERGFRVLAARPSAAESVLGHATLADLLADVDRATWSDLPAPQRHALAAAVLDENDGPVPAADPRAVGAGFLNVLIRLTADSPVVVGIDDLQWLDVSSAAAVAFAIRRLPQLLTLVATVRTDAATAATEWVQLPRPDAVRRIRLEPLAIGELHSVLAATVGHSISRPLLLRIHHMSGGNPFYAGELTREMERRPPDAQLALPNSLAELMRARIGRVHAAAAGALLTIASLGHPTIALVAEALQLAPADLVELLGNAEEHGVLAIAGQRLGFTHPLLAHAVHAGATPARLRWTHRRLAEVVNEPELRARHLALADPIGEPETLRALGEAADIARRRGAPAAAGELLELAIARGGATRSRRILLAQCLFDSGDPRRAREALESLITDSPPGPHRGEARQLLAMVRLYDDGFLEATELLEQALSDSAMDGEESDLRIGVLTTLAFAQLNLGRPDAALITAELAFAAAQRLGRNEPLARALGMRSMMRFFNGEGVEPADLDRVAALERADDRVPVAMRPSVQSALLRGWTGDYASAREHLVLTAQRCIAIGEEGELMLPVFHIVLFDIWRGELGLAAQTADDALRRAQHLGGDAASFIASSVTAAVETYRGNVQDARRHIEIALTAGAGAGYQFMTVYVHSLHGFLELSCGDHEKALVVLEPLLPMLRLAPRCTEIVLAGFLPDAAEALISRGRLEEAEPLLALLEDNGMRLDRPWMMAAGARCRALMSAGRGDLAGGAAQARLALGHLDCVDMPFERARTRLTLGRLERRLRRWRPANAAFLEALNLFEAMGTALWAAQVRAELDRGTPGRGRTAGLTPTERRVAELAAGGMSTKDVAAALFVTPKTVDSNLSRIYAKLGIHSRIELVHAMNRTGADGSASGQQAAPEG
jgi:DNA-binding CsgD family transcriptional regulator